MKKPDKQTLDEFALELDALRAEATARVGSQDARYIKRMIAFQRTCEISARILMVCGFISPLLWVFAVLLLALAKILDNMEIGHNVMHGQYDWMNDPHINSRSFDWDNAGDSNSWKRYHNYEHHTYTNILGKDRDFGYGLLRMSHDLPWRPKNLLQFFTYIKLSLLFEWGIAYHELAGERIFFGKKKSVSELPISRQQLKRDFFKKAGKQLFKDYVLYPLLCLPVWLPVLICSFIANILRNIWTSTIIFCGHFTEDTHVFTEEETNNETRGEWYRRQILGSSNIKGGRLFHIFSGHLSFQIEHHLFPDIPAKRYQQIAKDVERICHKHSIPYNSASFGTQYFGVLKRILRHSFPERARSVTST